MKYTAMMTLLLLLGFSAAIYASGERTDDEIEDLVRKAQALTNHIDAPVSEQAKGFQETARQRSLDSEVIEDILSKHSGWDDPSQANELEAILNAAGEMRMQGVERVMVDHIDYNPWLLVGRPEIRLRTHEMRYPCLGALIKIGLPAIPALIDYVKENGGDQDHDKQTELRLGLVFYAMNTIYSQGGFGEEMVRFRLTQEAKTLEGDEKLRLLWHARAR